MSQRDRQQNRVRNQFLFWSTVIVTGLNGVLLMVFRPTSTPPNVEPTVAVNETSLSGMMVGYLRAPDRQKPDILQNLVRAALNATSTEDPSLVDALKFLVEAFKNEAPLSPEWSSSVEGIVEMALHSSRLQAVAELEFLRIIQDQNHRRLIVPSLHALVRMGSDVGVSECLQILTNSKNPSLRRESVLLVGAYARDQKANPSRAANYLRAAQGLSQVVKQDALLRPIAALTLAQMGEPVPEEAVDQLLRAEATWSEVRAGVEVVRLGNMVGYRPRLKEVVTRAHLSPDTLKQALAVLSIFEPSKTPARSTASKGRR